MDKIKLIFSVVVTGIIVAFTYHIFENAVHESIRIVWDDWLNSETRRFLIIPACFVISLIFFGLQHYLDPKSEAHEAEGFGDLPSPTIGNYGKVLLIGFFSLLAGASLGPEAVLVPACMIVGAYIGSRIFDKEGAVKLLSAAGFIALFAAFFNSFVIGFLSVFLVTKQAGIKLKPLLAIVAVLASASTVVVLHFIEAKPYVELPPYSWSINVQTLVLFVVLVLGGYLSVFFMSRTHNEFVKMISKLKNTTWWQRGLLAASGLTVLYLAGGPLVEFTGNQSIVPMFQQAVSLGVWGLVWILIVKLAAISWSKAVGYRGGLIFPTIFIAAVLIAIVDMYVSELNGIYGLIAVLVGAFVADKKEHFLT